MATQQQIDYEARMSEVFNEKPSVNDNRQSKRGRKPGTRNGTSKNLTKKQKKRNKAMYDNTLGDGTLNYGFGVKLGAGTNAYAVQQNLLTGDDVVDIKLTDSKKNRGYIFYMQKDLQAIYEKSGPHAYDNEFQVHYWFLNFRFKAPDNSIIDIAVPTCYFNYEQFVTGSHVDFELKDVGPVSEKVMPLHNMKVNELLALEIDKKISAIFENKLEFEAMSVNFGTLHRHPGGSAHQSFSTTDLNINVKTEAHALGVVFPLADAEDDKPSFSAIIALDGGSVYSGGYYSNFESKAKKTANLAHCEYRTVNGKIQTGLNYEKNRCVAFNVMPSEQPSYVEKMFGSKPVRKSVVKYSNTENNLFLPEEKLLEIFEEVEQTWEASTHCVIPENVKLPKATVYVGNTKVVTTVASNGVQTKFTYANTKKDDFSGYSSDIHENEADATDVGACATSKLTAKTPHEKYLLAKQNLTKINANRPFINAVKKYITIENEENYLGSLDVTFENLETILNEYNTMSALFYGKGHKEEEIRFYCMNGIVDYRDIRDFLNENIATAMAIVEETHTDIQTLKDYEIADNSALKNRHLYVNPYADLSKANTPEEAEALKKDEAYDSMADAEAAKKQADEYVKENDTVVVEPESGVVDTLLGAVTKFMKG